MSAAASAARAAAASAAGSSGAIPHASGSPPARRTSAARRGRVDVAHLRRSGRGPFGDDLVAGRKDRDARARVHADARHAERRQTAALGRAKAPAGRDGDLAGADVLADGQHVLAGARGVEHLDLVAVQVRVFDHHDRVGTGGKHRAGVRSRRLALADADIGHDARRDIADEQQVRRRLLRGAVRVGRANGETVHRGAAKSGQALARHDVVGGDSPEGGVQRNDIPPFDRGTNARKNRKRVARSTHGEELGHTRRAVSRSRTLPVPAGSRCTPILTLPNPSQSFEHHLASLGLSGVGTVYRNQSVPQLYEHALSRAEAILGAGGQLCADTGKHTGRSPKDKFFVREPGSETHIDWSANQEIDGARFDALLARVGAYLKGKDVFSLDCYVGADPRYRLPVRIITQFAWHSLFARDLFIDTADGDEAFAPEFTVLNVPLFEADPARDGVKSGTFILGELGEARHPDRRDALRRRDEEVRLHGDELPDAAAQGAFDALFGESR